MSSSESENDCYGNMAQKLHNIKSKNKIERVVVEDTVEIIGSSKQLSKLDENTSIITIDDCNMTVNSTDNDEFSLDAIIALNSKKKPGRGRGGKRKSSGDAVAPSERVTRSNRRKTANSNKGRTSPVADTVPTPDPIEQNTSTAYNRGNARARGSRGRNRGSVGSTASPRGRPRGRRGRQSHFNSMNHSYCPTYSVGNTDEYPDQCDNLQLFAPTKDSNDVELVEEIDPLEDDNEEMSVKVYWQSLEIFKFKIRKYQKLTQVFQYFAEKEGVTHDKLLFTYKDKILKIDDTPESINYNIAKFIDGGIVNQNVMELIKRKNKGKTDNNGLKVKFQCQNLKKPYETTLRPEDKLGLAMLKCAEHLETPLERLKFYFDGDLLSSKSTPQELDFEGGECIDVKICS